MARGWGWGGSSCINLRVLVEDRQPVVDLVSLDHPRLCLQFQCDVHVSLAFLVGVEVGVEGGGWRRACDKSLCTCLCWSRMIENRREGRGLDP